MNGKTVCAVVVTYNRANLLSRCLKAILAQSHPVDGIYVIDNASRDNTAQMLLDNGFIKKAPPQNLDLPWEDEFILNWLSNMASIKFHYVKMHKNTGGAGGFYEGVKRAYEKGYDYLWLMDDDGFPHDKCLETLMRHVDKANFVAPLVVRPDNPNLLSFGLGRGLDDVKSVHAVSNKGLLWNNANPFNGVIISRTLISAIGFPKKEFFIWGDEAEYFNRAIRSGLGVVTVIDALFYHPKVEDWRRKKVLGRAVVILPTTPLKKYCFFRNTTFVRKVYFGFFYLAKTFLLPYILHYFMTLNFKDLVFFINAVSDGLFEKWGKEKRFIKG